jgi:hypothetical protein
MQDNTQGRAVTLKTKGDYRTPYVKAGWESARKGLPLDYALLDRAPNHHAAMAYETGRQIVLALRLAGETVPAWRAQSVTPTIQEAMRTAVLVNKAHVLHGTGPIIVLPKAA